MPEFFAQTLRSALRLALAGAVIVSAVVIYGFFRRPYAAPLLAMDGVPGPPMVSILLGHARSAPQLVLACDGPWTVEALPRAERIASGDVLAGIPVSVTGSDLVFGKASVSGSELRLTPASGASVAVDGRRYAGTVRVAQSGGVVSAYNDLDMETYLEGVLGAEMLLSWNEAALEAQAIVARTYALHTLKQARRSAGPRGSVSIPDDVMAQVYRGLAVRTPKAVEIVRRTRGMVLIYGGALIRAYFHNTCGGGTDPAHLFLDAPDIPPLMGRPCPHCEKSPHLTWKASFTKKELGALLSAYGNPEGRPVTLLTAVYATPRGRITEMSFSTAGGVSGKTLPAVDFRLAIGPQKLRSTWFTFTDRGATIEFEGRGWGHGVGMCQYGARAMGDAGLGSLDILGFYYPNADVVRIY